MSLKVFIMPDDGDEPIQVDPSPALVAQVDQERAATEELLSGLLTATLLDHIYGHYEDDERRMENLKQLTSTMLDLGRQEALGLITVSLEQLAHLYMREHDGIEAVAKKMHETAHEKRPDDCPFPDVFHQDGGA